MSQDSKTTETSILWTCAQCGQRINSEQDRRFGATIGVFHRHCYAAPSAVQPMQTTIGATGISWVPCYPKGGSQ